MDTTNIRKKIQYITIDSEFVQGTPSGSNNTFTVNLGTINASNNVTSNILLQNMRNVIGLKVVDFFVSQIGSNDNGSGVKYIDVLCPDLPDAAQILDERKSKIFARVPLERDFTTTNNDIIVNDKQWKSFNRQTNYFNPISIRQLNFQLYELTGATSPPYIGTYQLLQPDAGFYMILEVTTIDNDVITLPKEDPTVKVVEAIQSLEEKLISLFEQFPDLIKTTIPEPLPVLEKEVPIVPESEPIKLTEPVKPKIIDKKMYFIIAIILLLIVYYFMDSKK